MSLSPVGVPLIYLSKKLNPHSSVLVGYRNRFQCGLIRTGNLYKPRLKSHS